LDVVGGETTLETTVGGPCGDVTAPCGDVTALDPNPGLVPFTPCPSAVEGLIRPILIFFRNPHLRLLGGAFVSS